MRFTALALFFLLSVLGCRNENTVPESQEEALLNLKSSPFEHMFLQRSYPDNSLDLQAYNEAYFRVLKHKNSATTKMVGGQWTPEGPGNIGGRFNTVIVNPNSSDTLLAGSSTGGIFKTVDGGNQWYPVADDFSHLPIGHLAYDPNNSQIIYAGTGDPNISGLPHVGNGLYKSEDGGESWNYLGLSEASIISRIVVNPQNSSEIYVGTMGLPFERNEDRGLYKSSDGGLNWEKILYVNDESGVIDLAINPLHPDTLFAVFWNRIRNNTESLVSGIDAKIWRSQDGGQNWTLLDNGLPQEAFSRIGICMSAQDPDKLWALYVGDNYQIHDLYLTIDGGDSWSTYDWNVGLMNGALGGFGWYFGQIRVNPWDENELSILGVDMYTTFDGGTNWQMTTPPWWDYTVHADKHDLVYLDANSCILATDGGLYRSDDNMASWYDIENIPVTQFYRIGLDPHHPGIYTGGAQDNGTTRGQASDFNAWTREYGGDGFQPLFDPDEEGKWYAETQRGNLVYFDGFEWSNFNMGITEEDRRNWDMPIIMSEHNPSTLYTGTYRIYKNSLAPWSLWNPISEDLTDGVIYGDRYHTISTIGESRVNPDILYGGTTDGNVWRTLDGGETWTDISSGLPDRYVTNIKTSGTDQAMVFVALSGYKDNDSTPHLYRSDDYGDNWEAVAGDLPEQPLNHLEIFNDSTYFVASDFGVYFTMNSGQHWERVGQNMPMIPVFDIEIDTLMGRLVAGTFARSIMTIPLDSILIAPVPDLVETPSIPELFVYPNPVEDLLRISQIANSAYIIFDTSGKEIIRGIIHSQELDVSSLNGGMYMIHFVGLQKTLTFVKLE